MKAKIEVYELNSDKLIATYKTVEEFEANAKGIMPAQVLINDCVFYYGWDEIYDFV